MPEVWRAVLAHVKLRRALPQSAHPRSTARVSEERLSSHSSARGSTCVSDCCSLLTGTKCGVQPPTFRFRSTPGLRGGTSHYSRRRPRRHSRILKRHAEARTASLMSMARWRWFGTCAHVAAHFARRRTGQRGGVKNWPERESRVESSINGGTPQLPHVANAGIYDGVGSLLLAIIIDVLEHRCEQVFRHTVILSLCRNRLCGHVRTIFLR